MREGAEGVLRVWHYNPNDLDFKMIGIADTKRRYRGQYAVVYLDFSGGLMGHSNLPAAKENAPDQTATSGSVFVVVKGGWSQQKPELTSQQLYNVDLSSLRARPELDPSSTRARPDHNPTSTRPRSELDGSARGYTGSNCHFGISFCGCQGGGGHNRNQN